MNETGPDAAIKQLEESPKKKRFEGIAWMSVGVIVALLCVSLTVALEKWNQDKEKVDSNATKIETQNNLLDQQREQFEQCKGKKGENNPSCIKPIVPPVTITPDRVNSTAASEGLSASEVEAIAVGVVAKSSWRPTNVQYNSIAKIAAGLLPKQPTPAQVQNTIKATVASYCAGGRCKGKDAPTITPEPGKEGSPGRPGTPGADSTVPGPRGSDATDEQVSRSVAVYCAANDECRGDTGPAGRGIVSVVCNDDGKLLISYTDETTQVIQDSDCRVEPAPTITVTETVTPSLPLGR